MKTDRGLTDGEMELRIGKLNSEIIRYFADPKNGYEIVSVIYKNDTYYIKIRHYCTTG